MKFIHISDLHIGKRVNEFSMLEDQEYILKQILKIIDSENPQAVFIAGDVYDKSIPSTEAVTVLDSFLYKLSNHLLSFRVHPAKYGQSGAMQVHGLLLSSPLFQ